jgi:sensor domain CHASE-containing protein
MVTLPVRVVVFGFAAKLSVTVPLPAPDAPLDTVIQEALETAVHWHCDVVLTFTDELPPLLLVESDVALMLYSQGAAACVTVTVLPAMVTVPVRVVVFGFAAKLSVTVPLPAPDAPLDTVIQEALETAVHWHCDVVLTFTDELPPLLLVESDVALMLYSQGAAACVTVTVLPAMVTVPVRVVVFGFAAKLSVTVPLPAPDAPLDTVIQEAAETAVHWHCDVVLTFTDEFPPLLLVESDVALMLYSQGAAACVTVTVLPAMVTVPVRVVVFGFAAMLSVTVPLPAPDAPLDTVIQEALDTAVHWHCDVVLTFTDEFPPLLLVESDVALMLYSHGAAACVTVTVLPAMVTVPVRVVVFGFAAMLSVTVPLPAPDAPLDTVIQEALDTAVHWHCDVVLTFTDEFPPLLLVESDVALMLYSQGAAACVTVTVLPAMVTLPVRVVVFGFAAKLSVTVPLPAPDVPLDTVIQEAARDRCPLALLTWSSHSPNRFRCCCLSTIDVALMLYSHGAAACVTVTVLPAMVTVPVRVVVFGFAAKLSVTVPLPAPDAPLDTVIQEALDTAVHWHCDVVLTFTDELPPLLLVDSDVALTLYSQGAAACVTVTVLPAMVTVPVRVVVFGFAAKLSVTVPLPAPDAPLDTVIQEALETAVHWHCDVVVTFTEPLPLPLPVAIEVVLTEYSQAAAACVTVTVLPAIVTVPVREDDPVFAAKLKERCYCPHHWRRLLPKSRKRSKPQSSCTASVLLPKRKLFRQRCRWR